MTAGWTLIGRTCTHCCIWSVSFTAQNVWSIKLNHQSDMLRNRQLDYAGRTVTTNVELVNGKDYQ